MFVLRNPRISTGKPVKKSKINKNASFSGTEIKKSPKQRRKSIAAYPIVKKSEIVDSKPKKAKKTVNPVVRELENKHKMKFSTTKEAVENLIKFTSENPKLKNRLFNEQFPLFLQIQAIKVAQKYSKIVRLPLKHAILGKDSEICLIVPDVKGVPNKEHDKHQEHYEALLQRKGVENIKKIMTFHEFRTEYETFELKQHLVDLYDYFLVDGRISGKVVHKCGKLFYKKRKVPTPIKMQATKLKEHIQERINRTPLYLHGKGDCFSIKFGHSQMQSTELAENIFDIIEKLDNSFPGGMANVRTLNVFAFRGLSLPIYTTLKNQNSVAIPREGKKSNRFGTVVGELTTKLNTEVVVKPDGSVITRRIFQKKKENKEKSEIESTRTEQVTGLKKVGKVPIDVADKSEMTAKLKKRKSVGDKTSKKRMKCKV